MLAAVPHARPAFVSAQTPVDVTGQWSLSAGFPVGEPLECRATIFQDGARLFGAASCPPGDPGERAGRPPLSFTGEIDAKKRTFHLKAGSGQAFGGLTAEGAVAADGTSFSGTWSLYGDTGPLTGRRDLGVEVGAIGGRFWRDENANGTEDAGEDHGYGSWVLPRTCAPSSTTDSGGSYGCVFVVGGQVTETVDFCPFFVGYGAAFVAPTITSVNAQPASGAPELAWRLPRCVEVNVRAGRLTEVDWGVAPIESAFYARPICDRSELQQGDIAH